MAHFLLQSDDGSLDIEKCIVEDLLKHNKFLHTYELVSLKGLDDVKKENCYPVGTIDFVSKYMRNAYGIESEVPIEIPTYLQTGEFLKRNYFIYKWDEIPRKGEFFLKDVSQLKKFGGIVNTAYESIDDLFNYEPKGKFDSTLVLDKSHFYQVSEVLPIKAEYRVYVLDGEIEQISNYNGSPLYLPDVGLLNKAVSLISRFEKYLKSYTIDIAVGSFGTAILEIHNFASVGLYSTLWGDNLLYGYIDGINYLINDNTIKYLQKA